VANAATFIVHEERGRAKEAHLVAVLEAAGLSHPPSSPSRHHPRPRHRHVAWVEASA
jgi:hypothetical protein